MEVVDPATGEAWASVARCGSSEVAAAVDAARSAYDTHWSSTTPAERGALLRALSAAIIRESDDLARLETLDTGKPLRQSRVDVNISARYFTFYASAIEALEGATIGSSQQALVYTLREPFGVTGHIVPWNYPLQISGRTMASAVAAGNCCVLKPAEEASVTTVRLAELALEVGFPAGVLNVVPGLGEEAGSALSHHPGVDRLSFTGSREVGTLVAQAAAANIVPITLELGGKSPNIVFDDADLEAAMPVIVASLIQNAGQTCSAGSRLVVHERVHGQLVERLAQRFAQLVVARGLDDADIGPLISGPQRDRVSKLVADAAEKSRLVAGGNSLTGGAWGKGFFFEPTIFDDVPEDARIEQEEVFGPVLAVSSFASEEDALIRANGTEFGLVAAVWTRDVARAHRMAQRLKVGQVFINSYGAGGGVETPFGGYKRSGYGREKGKDALLEYTQVKSVSVRY